MAAQWQRLKVDISDYNLKPKEREEVADLIIERIYERTTKENRDADGKRFPGYSKSYINSLDFKIGGKSKSNVNLELSGDMLASIKLLSEKPKEIVVGFERGSEENAKADGNIRGTYGTSTPNPRKARNFLGVSDKELAKIVRYVKAKD